MALLDRIAAFATLHSMFSAGQRIGVAVSGGADSVFLLDALHQLGPRWNLRLAVLHIDHGLRGAESTADAQFVLQLAEQYGLPFHIRSAQLKEAPGNLEQAARQTRHDFYRELIASGTLDRVATGHTLSDQAETVLYRILRGTGLTGLRGILPVTEDGLLRPLLNLQRDEVRAWLRDNGRSWREDPTNRDLSYARNRIRHETLPALRAAFNPNLDEALAHLAVVAADEEAYWDQQLEREIPAARKVIVLKTTDITSCPARGRRLVRQAIRSVKGDLRQIDFRHIERILEMAKAQEGHDRVILPGADFLRSFDRIRIVPEGYNSNRDRDFDIEITVPGTADLPLSGTRLVLALENDMHHCDTVENKLDWQRLQCQSSPQGLPTVLQVRNWRPGDQYRRIGQAREEKIKLLFQQYRIPLWERRTWPVITWHGQILWSRLFGVAAEFAAGPNGTASLCIHEETTNRCQ